MQYKNIDDEELMYMIRENDETAKSIAYEKYRYIIDIVIRKYARVASFKGIEYNDLYQDALVGFVDALNKYTSDLSSIATFITLCVDRKLQNTLRQASTLKSKINKESLSLEYEYDKYKQPLMDIISDNNENNPLVKIEENENDNELVEKIKKELSDAEKEVFSLMINGLDYLEIALILNKTPKQVDNTRNRIRFKAKKILNIN